MRYIPLGFSLLFAVLSAPTLAADAEAGLLAVKSLGGVNGQALACAEAKVAARARELMLAEGNAWCEDFSSDHRKGGGRRRALRFGCRAHRQLAGRAWMKGRVTKTGTKALWWIGVGVVIVAVLVLSAMRAHSSLGVTTLARRGACRARRAHVVPRQLLQLLRGQIERRRGVPPRLSQ